MVIRTLSALAALSAILFASNTGHTDDRIAAVSVVCLDAQPMLAMADVDAREGRTVRDLILAISPYLAAHTCIRVPGVPLEHAETLLEYTDADGEESEVWRGRLPGASADVYGLVFVEGEGV